VYNLHDSMTGVETLINLIRGVCGDHWARGRSLCGVQRATTRAARSFAIVRGCIIRGLSLALCVGLGFLVRVRFALRSLAVWRVRAIAPSFVFSWRAFSSVSPCQSILRDACRRPGSDARSRPAFG
jgi:hypothetical protein